ncbi:hypothetical protein [Methanolobus sp. WCC5]|uniref:hypothetical protein n=1 Tax=Methanolobus sp. WCC5 TaxID=3125785 RepID=UPI003253EE8A
MTSEIVIMNRAAIAMAADSAVTLSGYSRDKIFPSAQKLFTLSDHAPVGIMVYGNADFMSVPWETIIKMYRSKNGNNVFPKLEDYANDFIDFLEGNETLFSEDIQDDMFEHSLYLFLNYLKEMLLTSIQRILHSEQRLVYDEELETTLSDILEYQYNEWNNAKLSPGFFDEFDEQLHSKYGETIDKLISKVFEEFPLDDDNVKILKTIIPWFFSRFPHNIKNNSYSGIVVAGFGESEIFPSFKSYIIEFMVCNKLKYELDKQETISSDKSVVISPFAQREMVDMFMRGIDSSIFEFSVSFLDEAVMGLIEHFKENDCVNIDSAEYTKLNEHAQMLVKDYITKMQQIQDENYTSPITNVVSMLPKDELASMAESLINLTSFKRKISLDSETVGGPIDVAIISKGDGLIWIKRKHYFKSELNPQYFINKYKGAYEHER